MEKEKSLMKKQNKKSKKEVLDINYLDLIPVRAEELQWFTDRRDRIVLKVENTGLFNKIAQKVFNKPQFTKVHLDQQGTFIWPLIDGERTVADIAALVKDEFGEAAEPLYPRIVKYFQIVESYHFIKFANKPSKYGTLRTGNSQIAVSRSFGLRDTLLQYSDRRVERRTYENYGQKTMVYGISADHRWNRTNGNRDHFLF